MIKQKKEKKIKTILTALVILMLMLLVTGITISLDIYGKLQQKTNQDSEFREWSQQNANRLSPFITDVNSLMSNYSYTELGSLASQYQSSITTLLNDIIKYNLSQRYESSRIEYTLFLQNLNLCCKYLELFSGSFDQNDLKIAILFFDSATEHINQFYAVLNNT